MKNISKLSMLFLAAVLGLSSCGGSEPEEQPKVPVLKVTAPEGGVSVIAAGGAVSVSYNVENPTETGVLSVKSSESWVSDIQVNASDVTADVAVNPGDGRSAELTFSYSGAESVKIKLNQLAAGVNIALSEKEKELDAEGGSFSVVVTSDRDWTLSGEAAWVKASAESGKSGDEVTFTVEKNTGTDPREVSFTFTCATNTVTLTVKQSGKDVLASIKDKTLKTVLMAADTDGDGKISLEEAAALKSVEYEGTGEDESTIMSLEGLEFFTGLEKIVLPNNNFLELDLSGRTTLTDVDVSDNEEITSINLKGCSALKTVRAALDKSLESIDLQGCTSLVSCVAYGTKLKAIDVSACTLLESLIVYSSSLSALDVSACTALTNLNAGCSTLASVKLPANSVITTLSLSESSKLSSLDLSVLPGLKSLSIGNTSISSLDLAKCPLLEKLDIDSCKKITTLDVSHNLHLKSISALFSGLSKVIMFQGQYDAIKDKCTYNIKPSMITTVAIDYPEDCTSTITDSGLRNYIVSKFDADGNGKISGSEAESVKELVYTGKNLSEIGSLVYFRQIRKLVLSNNKLTAIDLGPFVNLLEELDLSGNSLTELSFAGAKSLKTVIASNNSLTSCTGLSGSDLADLTYIDASHNKLTSFTCSYAKALKNVNLSYNELTSCDLDGCAAVTDLNVGHNHLTEDTQSFVRPFKFTALVSLDLSNNDFVKLSSDVTWTDKWTSLLSFNCSGCGKLQEVDLSSIAGLVEVNVKDCPRLSTLYLSLSANPQVFKDENTVIKRK